MKTMITLFAVASSLGMAQVATACNSCDAHSKEAVKKECPAGCKKKCCAKKMECPAGCEKKCCKGKSTKK